LIQAITKCERRGHEPNSYLEKRIGRDWLRRPVSRSGKMAHLGQNKQIRAFRKQGGTANQAPSSLCRRGHNYYGVSAIFSDVFRT